MKHPVGDDPMVANSVAMPTVASKLTNHAPIAAKTSILFYFFFLLFGTSLPFQATSEDFSAPATSRIFNQVVFSGLYLISFLSLLPQRKRILRAFQKEMFFSLFLLWCFLTVFWSPLPLLTLKRFVHVFGSAIVLSAALLHTKQEEDAFSLLNPIVIAYLPLSLLSVLLIPEAIQWSYPAWKGFTLHKNLLGQHSLACTILCLQAVQLQKEPRKRTVFLFLLIISLVLLGGSKSATAWITSAFLLLLAIIMTMERKVFRPALGKLFSCLFILLSLSAFFLYFWLSPTLQDSIFRILGKSHDFNSRVDIWVNLFLESKNHLFLGYGFDAYWVVESDAMDVLYRELMWQMNQGHNGYLDLLNETGVVGLSLFGLLSGAYILRLHRAKAPTLGKWFVFSALVVNLTESTLFRLHSLNGTLFLYSYLSLSFTFNREESIRYPGAEALQEVL